MKESKPRLNLVQTSLLKKQEIRLHNLHLKGN